MVPIRRAYTELVREALEHSQNGRFIQTTGQNIVYWIGSGLDIGDGEGLSLRRARSTWLHAHLLAGTSSAGVATDRWAVVRQLRGHIAKRRRGCSRQRNRRGGRTPSMSVRGEHRRRERAARKGRLCVADAYRLDQNRRLPKYHPSFAKENP